MKIATFAFAVLCTPSLAGPCLSYQGEVALRGILSRHTFAEQPNYENIAKGDSAATYFFVSPAKALCVDAGHEKENEPRESNIKQVQLAFRLPAKDYEALRPNLGKRVQCHGDLYHTITGHHHSRVLLINAKCNAA